MTRQGKLNMATLFLTFCGWAWLIGPLQTQAATTVDTFQFTGNGKEYCQGNPKFSETTRAKTEDGVTLIITRDPLSTDDATAIRATINNSGNADIDAIIMNGLSFSTNNNGSARQISLFGALNNGHFLSIQGQAKFDKLGALIKVSGTFAGEITGTYTIDKLGTQSAPVTCIFSGTFSTGKKL